MIRRLAAPTFFVMLIACVASAQSASEAVANEFGRGSGGEIQAIAKSSTRGLSGSLGLRLGSRDGFEGSVGGSLANDRLFFFASAARVSGFEPGPRLQATDATVTAQPVDWTTITASLRDQRNATVTMPHLSSSFLSLRSTSILSDRMILEMSVSRRSTD